jgi:hypothetical protein
VLHVFVLHQVLEYFLNEVRILALADMVIPTSTALVVGNLIRFISGKLGLLLRVEYLLEGMRLTEAEELLLLDLVPLNLELLHLNYRLLEKDS